MLSATWCTKRTYSFSFSGRPTRSFNLHPSLHSVVDKCANLILAAHSFLELRPRPSQPGTSSAIGLANAWKTWERWRRKGGGRGGTTTWQPPHAEAELYLGQGPTVLVRKGRSAPLGSCANVPITQWPLPTCSEMLLIAHSLHDCIAPVAEPRMRSQPHHEGGPRIDRCHYSRQLSRIFTAAFFFGFGEHFPRICVERLVLSPRPSVRHDIATRFAV